MPTHITKTAASTIEGAVPSLASSQRLSELALESGRFGSWRLNVETQQAVRSLRHDQIFGYQELHPAWTYSTFLEHVDTRDRDRVDAEYRSALEQAKDWEFEARIHRVDGEERWIWAKGKHFRDDTGKVIEIVGLVGDITERKRTEDALRKSEQLAAVGRLASTIAHEINNPLESVTNLLYLAGTVDSWEESKQYIAIAEVELQRISAITNQTLRFHRTKPSLRRATAGELLPGIGNMFAGRLLTHGITFTQRHITDRTTLCFDGEIRQVLTSLIGNAIDASKSGGHLAVRSYAGRSADGTEGIVLLVSDTGTGISPEIAKKMYDPLFSTKGAEGSGLGLWVSFDIVHRHHGALTMRTSQDNAVHGTVFRLFLRRISTPRKLVSHDDLNARTKNTSVACVRRCWSVMVIVVGCAMLPAVTNARCLVYEPLVERHAFELAKFLLIERAHTQVADRLTGSPTWFRHFRF